MNCGPDSREEPDKGSQKRNPSDIVFTVLQVLSRHSSPATTPPMVGPSQAERLHKACDVLLRAASKIQDLPPGIQQEEVVVEEEAESITLYPNSQVESQPEQINVRQNQAPLYEINLSVNSLSEANRPPKKVKSREKIQVGIYNFCFAKYGE